MKTIGARLAVWYALASTATLACLLVAGYYLLEDHLVHGVDALNNAKLREIHSQLGAEYATLSDAEVDRRIRQNAEFSSSVFYIEIHRKGGVPVFLSRNLRGKKITQPSKKGLEVFSVTDQSVGELRVGEMRLGNTDIMVGTTLEGVHQGMEGYIKVSLLLLFVMATVSAVIGQGLSRLALRPIRNIRAIASRIRSDNLSERIPLGDVRDEITDLAELLNGMFDRLENSFRQTRRFTAEASHELKTPLSLVRLQAEKLVLEGGLKPTQEEAVQVQLEEIARLNQIIEELLFLSRAEAHAITLQTRTESPRKFLEIFAADARVLAESRGAHFAENISGEGTVSFDAKWLRQVLLNLVANALNAAPRGSTITLTAGFSRGAWHVAVEDEGPGVPPEQRERIFERFVRLGGPGDTSGSGLGLAISRSIVGLHRGVIRAEAGTDGRGLRVIFEIPVADGALPGEPPAPAFAAVTTNR